MTGDISFTQHRPNASISTPTTWRKLVIRSCLLLLVYSTNVNAKSATTLGWLEWAWLKPGDIKIKTKLDTGAKTSSIDAVNIEPFEREDKTWVRFTIPLARRPEDSDLKQDITLERRVIRVIKIKDHKRDASTRYVVNMSLCIGGKKMKTAVSLADRKHFNYPLLLGRTALKNGILVDPSKTFTASDSCRPVH